MTLVYFLFLFIIISSFLLAFVRIVKGPGMLDKVLSLDFLGIVCIGSLAILGMILDNEMLIDMALLFAPISFVTAFAFAKYLYEKEGSKV